MRSQYSQFIYSMICVQSKSKKERVFFNLLLPVYQCQVLAVLAACFNPP